MGEMQTSQNIKEMPASSWNKLAKKRIYFAHQSVGFNIIDGMIGIMKDHPDIQLIIKEQDAPSLSSVPCFIHFKIGTNGDPISKIDDFAEYIKGRIGSRTDIALFKFCYLDITVETDIQTVFNHYKSSMAELKQEYPRIQFVHMTVPLKTVQGGVKAVVKRLLGRQIGGYEDNIARNKFNAMMIKEYSGNEPLFDIAGVESLSAGSTPVLFKSNDVSYFSLSPEYTNDGGHLNETGKKVVAGELLVFLADL
jgi:hypothetical protein